MARARLESSAIPSSTPPTAASPGSPEPRTTSINPGTDPPDRVVASQAIAMTPRAPLPMATSTPRRTARATGRSSHSRSGRPGTTARTTVSRNTICRTKTPRSYQRRQVKTSGSAAAIFASPRAFKVRPAALSSAWNGTDSKAVPASRAASGRAPPAVRSIAARIAITGRARVARRQNASNETRSLRRARTADSAASL